MGTDCRPIIVSLRSEEENLDSMRQASITVIDSMWSHTLERELTVNGTEEPSSQRNMLVRVYSSRLFGGYTCFLDARDQVIDFQPSNENSPLIFALIDGAIVLVGMFEETITYGIEDDQ